MLLVKARRARSCPGRYEIGTDAGVRRRFPLSLSLSLSVGMCVCVCFPSLYFRLWEKFPACAPLFFGNNQQKRIRVRTPNDCRVKKKSWGNTPILHNGIVKLFFLFALSLSLPVVSFFPLLRLLSARDKKCLFPYFPPSPSRYSEGPSIGWTPLWVLRFVESRGCVNYVLSQSRIA